MNSVIAENNEAQQQVNDSHDVATYDWQYILNVAYEHKRDIIMANIIAMLATMASVPVPLLLPLLVDEVLLNKPANVVATINYFTPQSWHGPV